MQSEQTKLPGLDAYRCVSLALPDYWGGIEEVSERYLAAMAFVLLRYTAAARKQQPIVPTVPIVDTTLVATKLLPFAQAAVRRKQLTAPTAPTADTILGAIRR